MADLDKIGQEINAALGELHLERVTKRRAVYEIVIDEHGERTEIDTGETESAVSKEDIILMETWLKRNEIKAEINKESQLGKLRKMLNAKKEMPRIDHENSND